MMHGKGTLFFENGGKYEATWDNGIATEVFKYIFSNFFTTIATSSFFL